MKNFLFCATSFFASCIALHAATATLTPTEDSYVEQPSPNSNFGTSTLIKIKTASGSANRDGYLKFDFTGIGSNGTAQLRLNAKMADSGVVSDLGVYEVAATNWGETSITWNNRPTPLGARITFVTNIVDSYNWFDFGVTPYIRAQQGSGKVLVSMGLHSTNVQDSVLNVKPRETGGTSPQLVLNEVFVKTGSMLASRGYATATLLTNGMVLVTGGSTSELYNPVTEAWRNTTGSINNARTFHTATLLLDGRVLIAGGSSGASYVGSSEVFNPVTETWTTTTGGSIIPRDNHSATLLTNGLVLVAGGRTNGLTRSAELFNPATGTWSATGSLVGGRAWHTAVRLTSGLVLIAGGNLVSDGAELYNPGSGTWATTTSLNYARDCHTMTLLPSGKVLVAGGNDGLWAMESVEVFDPSDASWTASSMNFKRAYPTATLLPNGKVLLAGGLDNSFSPFNLSELYDPSTGSWTQTGSLNAARGEHHATLLANGLVLLGGTDTTAELYVP